MLQVEINGSKTVEVDKKSNEVTISGNPSSLELIKHSEKSYTAIGKKRIHKIEVLSKERKHAKISIDNKVFELGVSDHIDQVLKELGMNETQSTKIKEIKAPMPGSLLTIQVNEGDEVQQGDQLLVLEAMKMENVIKSSGDGKVSKIHVSEKDNVEKNQVLITFD